MANPNAGLMVAEAWDMSQTLSRYGRDVLTVGYWRNKAYVRLWDFRKGYETWRRYPNRDGQQPKNLPPPFDPFASAWLYDVMK